VKLNLFKDAWCTSWKRNQGQESFCPKMCTMSHCRSRRQAQNWTQSQWLLGTSDGSSTWIQLHWSKQEESHQLEWADSMDLPGEPQEIHPWNKDGVCWTQKEKRASWFNSILKGSYIIDIRSYLSRCYLLPYSHFRLVWVVCNCEEQQVHIAIADYSGITDFLPNQWMELMRTRKN